MFRRLCLLILMISSPLLWANTVTITSPNGDIKVSVTDHGHPSYTVYFKEQEVISSSKLGLAFAQSASFAEGFTIKHHNKRSHQSQWQQPWGEHTQIEDNHNQLLLDFQHPTQHPNRFSVRIKVFNDGLGFRYEVPEQKGLTGQINISDELTEFRATDFDNATAWWIPARGWNRYEYVYNTTRFSAIDRVHTPFTYRSESGIHVSIHEAALVDYAAMTLDLRRDGRLKADLTPWSDGVLVKKKGAFTTPWRTIQVSDSAAGLVNSTLILNLNEPNKLGNVDWVKPGKYVGIWWGMHIGENTWGSGEKHGATTAEVKRYMDFAAKYNFSGVLVEGWNHGWDGDWYFNGDVFNFTKAYDDFDIAAISAHGKKVGVELIGHHETSGNVTNYRHQMEDGFALYQQNGVTQVKTGYVADAGQIKRVDENGIVRREWHDGQFMVNEYLHNVVTAAGYGISINTHEPIKDTGLRRTYPNWITREGARGMEFNAWGSPPNPPEHTAILPYTRLLSGPMDFTPGIFDMGFKGLGDNTDRPQTTLAKQLALYVVVYSPLQMAADLPRNYEANLPAFQFILDVPVDWTQSKALAGDVGDFIVMARQDRHSNDWYVGGLTDEAERNIALKLDFLSPNTQYIAKIYRDGEDAQWQNNPYAIDISEQTVSASDTLKLRMAQSGGFAISLKAVTP